MIETFDPGAVNPHSSRKHRRLDDSLSDGGDTRPVGPSLPPSYKESLMKDSESTFCDADAFFDDEDVEILEGDVSRSLVDSIISIDFSDRVRSLAEKSLDQTLVVKLLGHRIGYNTLRTKIYEIWKPQQALRLMDIENDYFLVTFKLRSDFLKIRLPGLPVPVYKKSLIEEIGESIGHVIKLDSQTEWGRRGRFARLAISVDLSKPLVSKIMVNGKIQLIEYESLPFICFHCGRYGHAQDTCPVLLPAPVSAELVMEQAPANHPKVTHLANLLDAHGNWDTHKLSALFDIAVIPHVLSIQCPDPLDVPDMPTWRLNVSQTFDIKSAYTSLMGNLWDTESQIWKMIWSLRVPQRLRIFLWLTLKGRLMTNAERFRRSLCSHTICPCCQSTDESVLHVLRDCSHALEVWNRLIPPGGNASFYSGGIIDWLHSNVTRNELHLICGLPWQVLFVSIIWQLWKARNDLVFNGTPPDAGNILHRSILWARYYNECVPLIAPVCPVQPTALHWQRPSTGWVCLSTDGAVSIATGMGSVGGIFRSDDGSWILGFNKTIGILRPLQAELWEILLGLQLAWENGFERLLIQSDNREAIKRLNASTASSDPCSLVRSIAALRSRRWATETQWIPREGNKPADMLAKLDNLPCFTVTVFSQPPEHLLSLLDFDKLTSL
ncbi:hypothetical protein V6N12_003314 [Hibiscus sabdariffa]|uniref:CCHC-type domain-containing protein n=1 Tax=Hibiscus sabdariffa TaxID=183260 RepID=A0ABR2EBJ1_9ROSI